MDTILKEPVTNTPFFMLQDIAKMMGPDGRDDDGDEIEKVSVWVKEKDIIRASINVEKLTKLDPGVYSVDYNRDLGFFVKEINTKSDELFVFSDSIVVKLLEEINLFWAKSDLYKQNKLIHKRGILLEGFPGTGKSSVISILSNEIMKKGGVVFKVKNFRNLSDYVEFIRTEFRVLQPETPIITIIEDLDQYDDVEVELLDFLDGKTHIDHHVIITTSNNTENIPDTFLRPSRIDLKIEIPMPSKLTRREYFKFKNVSKEDIEELVNKSDKFSLADLKELYICVYLLDYSVDDAIAKISSPRDKKNYLNLLINASKIGI